MRNDIRKWNRQLINTERKEINYMIITIFRKRLNRIIRLFELLILSASLFAGSAAAR